MLPRASVVTPNVPEARALAGDERLEGEALARAVHALGPRAVVLTGGHREVATDVFCDGEQVVEIPGERYPDGAAHGSGCTHAATLAARLALGDDPLEAARAAKVAAAAAVRDGLRELGAGAGPVDVIGLRRPRAGGASTHPGILALGDEVPAHEAGPRRGPARRGRCRRARGRGARSSRSSAASSSSACGRRCPSPPTAGGARRGWCATSPMSRATPTA